MLRVEKNKKGWLMIVEAVIAVMILFGFVFIAMAKQAQEIKSVRGEQTFYDVANLLAEKVQTNEAMRNQVFVNDAHGIKTTLEIEAQKINARLNVSVAIPPQFGDACSLGTETPQGKEIYSSAAIISTATDPINKYEPKKLCIFVWQE